MNLIHTAYSPGQGYSGRGQDPGGSVPGSNGMAGGSGILNNLDTYIDERVMDYNRYMKGGMEDEWGSDKGVKPNGTQLINKKKKKIKFNKKRKKIKSKNLEIGTKFDRITRNEPKFIGRVQDQERRKGPTRKNPGAWSHNNQILFDRLPSQYPETWAERSQRDVYI